MIYHVVSSETGNLTEGHTAGDDEAIWDSGGKLVVLSDEIVVVDFISLVVSNEWVKLK